MVPEIIFEKLEQNKSVFKNLLENTSEQEFLWSQQPDKWCILEIVCHLYDEEREDFRKRVACVLKDPEVAPPPIDPVGWVKQRNYKLQAYDKMVKKFIREREKSIEWLKRLEKPKWNNTYIHPKLGSMSAYLFLSNWLAHDYLHIRQIIKLKFDYLHKKSGISLDYAGDW
jgi:hypothetical protein